MSPIPTPTGGGAFGMLGGLMMPITVLLALRKAPPGPVKRLLLAGAVSPETALKPSTAKITRPIELNGPTKRGIVVAMPDGRFWVDVPRFKRQRMIWAIALGLVLAVVAELAWLIVPKLL